MIVNINTAYRKFAEKKGSIENVISEGEGIIRHFAGMYGQSLDSDDLYQTGVVGLLKAVKTFDESRGSAFSTWACACVISEIRHYVRREQAYLRDEDCTDYSDDSLSEEINLSKQLQKQTSFHLDLEDKILLEEAFVKLKPLQNKVVDLIFFHGMTQQQTADELGMTQRRVSRIKCGALKVLRSIMDSDSFRLMDEKKQF